MNVENILRVADAIEKAKPKNNKAFLGRDREPDTFDMRRHHGGTAACFIGWAGSLFKKKNATSYDVARLFGVPVVEAKNLCIHVPDDRVWDATPAQGAACLRKFAETGDAAASWRHAMRAAS
jgi:hypothetical protein